MVTPENSHTTGPKTGAGIQPEASDLIDLAFEDVSVEALRHQNPMSKITDDIFIGKISDPLDRELLQEIGIKSILSLNGKLNLNASELGVEKVASFNLVDGGGNSHFALTDAIVTLGSLVKEHGPVLVHCQAGVSRSPSIVAAHIALVTDQDFDSAVDLIATSRRVNITPALRTEVGSALEALFSRKA